MKVNNRFQCAYVCFVSLLWHAAGEMLHMAEPFLEKNVHPTVIVRGYVKALEDAIRIVDELSFPIDVNDRSQMLKIVNSCIGTKFTNQFGDLMAVSATFMKDHDMSGNTAVPFTEATDSACCL